MTDIETLTKNAPKSDDSQFAKVAKTALLEWNERGVKSNQVTTRLDETALGAMDEVAFRALLESRHSLRDFDQVQAVDQDRVRSAADLANATTPSGCNRQPCRAHLFFDRETIDKLLEHQDGNGGFGDRVPALAVVTSDAAMFSAARERNARWVEGGLFAMTLVWALHGYGFGTCMLNCSLRTRSANAIRQIAKTKPSEDIVVMVAIGHPRHDARVTVSPRYRTTSVPPEVNGWER